MAGTQHAATTAAVLRKALQQADLSREGQLETALRLLRRVSGCESVGIRLVNDDGNLPFDTAVGFPARFCSDTNRVSLAGEPCLCIQLLTGTLGTPQPELTAGGSFLVGTARELHSAGERFGTPVHLIDPEIRFETVALTPIRNTGVPLGLIHIADRRPHRLSGNMMNDIESLAGEIGRELVLDAMWPAAPWLPPDTTASERAVCPLCGHWRDPQARWHEERRRRPRVAHWTVRTARQVICPTCLPFHSPE